jgi:hypothetical protein
MSGPERDPRLSTSWEGWIGWDTQNPRIIWVTDGHQALWVTRDLQTVEDESCFDVMYMERNHPHGRIPHLIPPDPRLEGL